MCVLIGFARGIRNQAFRVKPAISRFAPVSNQIAYCCNGVWFSAVAS